MRVAILSRNPRIYSTHRLALELRKRGAICDIVNPLACELNLPSERGTARIRAAGHELPTYDQVIARIGASITHYGLAVLRHFELLGSRPLNSSQAIADSRDKARAMQVFLREGLPVPASVLTRDFSRMEEIIQRLGGFPVVAKVLQGTQGVGVMLLEDLQSLRSVCETLHGLGQDVLLQRYVREGKGSDLRVIVVHGEVLACMERTAPAGDFRSNIHRGGVGKVRKLSPETAKLAVQAARVLGLELAGVDLIESRDGPQILEVNSSPGFQGIEQVTGLNIAGEIAARTVP